MKLDVYLKGEVIDLCIPTRKFAEKSDWYSWFNDQKVTRYLRHGKFPNTPKRQLDFFEGGEDRLILIISDKNKYIGVVSLSQIDLKKKEAELGIVINKQLVKNYSLLMPLESVARISQHGFDSLGLERIYAGQHVGLSGWQQRLELLGYRLEGIRRRGFVKGREVADTIVIAAVYDDYQEIRKRRGEYWDSAKKMEKRIAHLPPKKFFEDLSLYLAKQGNAYYKRVFNL